MGEGSIKFSCECGKAYKVPDKYAGKRIKCKNCGETVAVPSSSEQISSARAAAVSNRSVVGAGTSKRVSSEGSGKSSSGKVASASGKVASTSGKVASASGKVAPAREASSAPVRKPGGDTEVCEVVDLTPNLKKYEKKRDEEMARGTGKVVLFADGKPVKSFRLDKEPKTAGRSSSCDIALDSKSVSKNHVKFEYMMGMFIATDMQSTNGLVVNGKKIRRAMLKDGDILQLGTVVLRVDVGK
jgi:hypothetical protein